MRQGIRVHVFFNFFRWRFDLWFCHSKCIRWILCLL